MAQVRRRDFIAALGAAAAWPVMAGAQQANMPVIGYLSATNPDPDLVRGFHQGLKEGGGYVEGGNIAIDYRWGDGQPDRLAKEHARLDSAPIAACGRRRGDRMKRRDFIAAFGAAAVWPFTARAQERERVRTLGVIMAYAEHDPEGQARLSVLRQQLQKLGWAEGRNIRIEVRWAAGRPDLMQTYGRELVGLPADVLIGNSTPLLTVMRQLTRTIPIVFTQVADPVASGFVSNYARPDGNITGFTGLDATIAGKWLEVLKEAVPSVQRATVLLNPDQANYPAFVQAIESAASALKIPVSAAAARDGAGIEQAITGLAGQTDRGLIILPGPVNHTQRGSIIGLAAKYRLPAIYPLRYYAKEGGLLHYGVDQADQWTKAAGYVDRILRGEKPSDLPVQAATKFELAINLSTAKALGLEVPPTVLARADEVIE